MHIKHHMNSLLTLQIYKHIGSWCFNDDDHGLRREPFVLGMTEIIDHVITEFKLGELFDNYRVIFSDQKFPKYQGHLFYQYSEHNGVWYALSTVSNPEITEESKKGWLCPATLKYFDFFPKYIYFKIEPMTA